MLPKQEQEWYPFSHYVQLKLLVYNIYGSISAPTSRKRVNERRQVQTHPTSCQQPVSRIIWHSDAPVLVLKIFFSNYVAQWCSSIGPKNILSLREDKSPVIIK
jgi:hypothetical protein